MTLEEVIYKRRWVDGIKDGSLVTDAAIAEAVREHLTGQEDTILAQVRKLADQGISNGGAPVNVYRLDSALKGKHVID